MNTEIQGAWWIPDKPDNVVQGTLTIENDNLNLELNEKFKTDIKSGEIDVLNGKDKHNAKITLYKIQVYDHESRRISVTYAIFGHHFGKGEDVKFTLLSFYFENFANWLNKEVIKIKRSDEESMNVLVNGYNLEYQLDGFEFKIKYSPTYHGSSTTLNIEHKPLILINSIDPILLDDYIKLVWSLQDFFILLTNRKIFPFGFRTMGPEDKELSIIFRESNKPIIEHYFGDEIPFKAIDKNLDELLNNWLQKRSKLKTSRDLYLGLIYNENIYSEFKLLAYTQLLESYHRNFLGGVFLSTSDYEPIRTSLLSALPDDLKEDHRSSLNSRIKYGYEFSLRKRLKDILGKYDEYDLSTFITDMKLFENQVISTRNYLTHYDDSDLSEIIQKDEGLDLLNLKLKLLCYILLLIEIGISKKQIKNFLKYSSTKTQIEYLEKKNE